MALDKKVKDLLNKFADSMPALRIPDEPYEKSNPKLGDILDDALKAEDAKYTPASASHWASPAPETLKAAIDRIAKEVSNNGANPIPT